MSRTEPNPSSDAQSVLNTALEAYERMTKIKLLTHPLAAQIQSCDSPTAILSVLRDLIQQFDQRYTSDQRLTNWPNATVKVLYAFSGTLGDSVGHALSPANVVLSGIGVVLLVAKDVVNSQDVLIDILVRIESYFKRLESYTEVPPTPEMTNVMVKITTEVLSIVAFATDSIKHGGSEKFMKKLMDVRTGDARSYLSKFTIEVVQMAIVETSKVTTTPIATGT
ncbi:hypothetical protein BJV77DRAFT_1157897 [Russula vinacea]|nr:hypothetical protein BJV77DRAFT_1157897 [Russula vinacea]